MFQVLNIKCLTSFYHTLIQMFLQGFAEKVIYAINAGGEAHMDIYGINYSRDPLRSVGTASDYGKQLLIGKLVPCHA